MDYNNILNNKRKFNDLKNKTLGMINKATDKITEVTSTAVDTVVDTVKNIGSEKAKLSIFELVVGEVNEALINATLENDCAKIKLVEYTTDVEGVISVEDILKKITASYDEDVRNTLTSSDYIEALFTLVGVHYKHESGVNYEMDKRIITLSIIPKNEEDNGEKEHVCNCEEECEVCSCKQESLTIEKEEN